MSKKIGVTELAKRYAKQYEISFDRAKVTIDSIINVIHDALVEGNDVSFMGEFTLEVKDRDAREVRNPKTGEAMTVPASKTIRAKIGSNLKEDLNK